MDCWEVIVDHWCSDTLLVVHNNAKDRRDQMVGVPHHQGSRNLAGYGEKWVCGLLQFSCKFFFALSFRHPQLSRLLILCFALSFRRSIIKRRCLGCSTIMAWPI